VTGSREWFRFRFPCRGGTGEPVTNPTGSRFPEPVGTTGNHSNPNQPNPTRKENNHDQQVAVARNRQLPGRDPPELTCHAAFNSNAAPASEQPLGVTAGQIRYQYQTGPIPVAPHL
jgi:hypothetical protein